jgi:hypothetical protein
MLLESKFFPRHVSRAFAAIAIAVIATLRAAPADDDPEGRALLQSAQRMIGAYHDGHRDAHNVLRVVYFHPSDRDPLPNYAERLDRVMNDISDFYRDGLRRFGIENDGLPLERKDGRLLLHVVRGKKPASAYHHESGYDEARESREADEATAEIREALSGTFDLDHECVLVIYGLCRKTPDGRYVFDAPYFGEGRSDQRRGLCHVADCELLDPARLTDTTHRMVYTEHYYARVDQTVAAFNTCFLGGIAHELAHGLGLNLHDAGHPAEQRFGVSLTGSGNRNYRAAIWSDGPDAYLSQAAALQLASHPLFTGSNRGRTENVHTQLERMNFASARDSLEIHGRIVADIPPYAVIAHVWPRGTDEHGAQTFPAVLNNGEFSVQVSGLQPNRPGVPSNAYAIWLATIYVNGAVTWREYQCDFDRDGKPDAVALNTAWLVQRAESAVAERTTDARALLTDDAIALAASAAKPKLRVLREALDPTTPFDLASIKADRAFLSDAAWLEAQVGWGQPARNHSWFDGKIQNGVLISIAGAFFEKVLYAHSPSRYAFALDGKWKTFTATIGLCDGANPNQGSAVFRVIADGRELYRSPILRPGARQDVKVDIAAVRNLELLADGGEGHNFNSWAIWAAPLLSR